MTRIDIGVDPGADGGICVIESTMGKSPEISFHLFSKNTTKDSLDYAQKLRVYARSGIQISATIEKVHGFPGTSSFAAEKLGRSSEKCLILMLLAEVSFKEKTPRSWQKFYNIKKKKGESGTKWKNRLRSVAEKLYPSVKFTNPKVDCLLLAHYNLENN